MQEHEPLEAILDMLADVTALQGRAATLLERVSAMIGEHVKIDRHSAPGDGQHRGYLSHNRPVVNPMTFAVEWRGQHCSLGPTILFRLIQQLAGRPGYYFTYDILMDRVWKRRCSNATIRSTVKRLRRVMCKAGMPELAAAIRGRGECYGVFLDDNCP